MSNNIAPRVDAHLAVLRTCGLATRNGEHHAISHQLEVARFAVFSALERRREDDLPVWLDALDAVVPALPPPYSARAARAIEGLRDELDIDAPESRDVRERGRAHTDVAAGHAKLSGRRLLLNSAVLAAAAYGTYQFRASGAEELLGFVAGRDIVADERDPEHEVLSRIGYQETATMIEETIGGPRRGRVVPLSREPSILAPGDEAFVVRLRYRVDPTRKGAPIASRDEDWELAILRRLS